MCSQGGTFVDELARAIIIDKLAGGHRRAHRAVFVDELAGELSQGEPLGNEGGEAHHTSLNEARVGWAM